MSEYCEYMWDPTRGRMTNTALARSIYVDEAKFDVRDRKLAIKTVRAILREMPGVDLKHCTDEYITRFLLARKYRTEQAAALIAAYQAQIAHRQDIFGNLTARDPPLQRALRAGIPGVLPARDRKGRCVLVILASQWDPIAVPALSVQRAIFLVLETLIQDPRNQQCGFVAVVDWSGFSLRQGGALGAAALRNLIAALRGRFPARFKAVHFLSAPLYVQATLALVKPFLDEKTRHKIYLHGNNLSTLHEHLPTDILPAELGGTGPAFNPGLWAEPVIHSAMKEAELAASKRDKDSSAKKIRRNVINGSEESAGNNEKQLLNEQQQRLENETKERRTENIKNDEDDIDEKFARDTIHLEDDDTAAAKTGRESRTSCVDRKENSDETTKIKDESSIKFERNKEEEEEEELAVKNRSSNEPIVSIEKLKNETSKSRKITRNREYENNGVNDRYKLENRWGDGNRNLDTATTTTTTTPTPQVEKNREIDDRTRFRVYRDVEDNETDVRTDDNTKSFNFRANSESEDIECLELPSETNSNEFEMISSQPESDESPDNSLETLRVEKIVTKVGRTGNLPEEANLIT